VKPNSATTEKGDEILLDNESELYILLFEMGPNHGQGIPVAILKTI